MAIEQWGWTCHTLSDRGLPFSMVISEDPWHSHLFPSVWQRSCHYLFLRLRTVAPGILTPNLPLLGECSNRQLHRHSVEKKENDVHVNLLFSFYLPLEKRFCTNLGTLPLRMPCAKFGWNCSLGSLLKKSAMYFRYFAIIFSWKTAWAFIWTNFEQTWIPV